MRLLSVLWFALAVFLAFLAGITEVNAATAYVPIRQAVSTGTYHSPNYLSVVSVAIGQENAYQMFGSVVGDKYPHAVGRFGKDETLVRALQKQRSQRGQLIGHYAEERFVQVNREAGWRKVADRFAKQRDVWRRVDGRIEYAQLKTLGLGKSAPTLVALADRYIDAMRSDSGRGQARLFLVPDDHLDAVRGRLEERHAAAMNRRDAREASWLSKQTQRLSPQGANYETLAQEADIAQQAGQSRIVAKYAGPAITVIFLAGSTGYETYRWSNGQSSGAEFAMQMGKTGSVVTLGLGTSYLVAKSEFLLASPYRAGGVVTGVIFLAEEGWLIYQYGGFSNAFLSPAFFVKSGGNVGAATLGLIGFVEGAKLGAIIGTPFGPWGTVLGVGIGGISGGAIGGIVGDLGGAAMTDWMLETFSPEFYYGMKLDEIDKAEAKLDREINRLSDLSRPLSAVALAQ